ncbi:low-density lipoprotein receptor-like isoform X2 [Apostichopus japonicus]|uniref:low-density lipoprotein receptor-like isoform X2 n=1 Tax=Stichopus japonicus TaxID=307972 RepID=UPI003AB90F5D
MLHRVSVTLLNCFVVLVFRGVLCCTFTWHSVDAKQVCQDNEFECDNGNCIDGSWVCDSFNDCSDRSDEVECPNTCTQDYFRCDNGECIKLGWQCDNDTDCTDGSDEVGCEEPSDCPAHMFTCADGFSCIPLSWQCDGAQDCTAGSDEANCYVEVYRQTYTCLNGTEVDAVLRCDSNSDCPDGEDEEGCIDCPGRLCDDARCIRSSSYCDGVTDCTHGEDEPATCNLACMEDNGGCQQRCVQSGDAVICSCFEGYQVDVNNITVCKDRDECTENLNSCPGAPIHCHNEVGSYTCVCPSGFQFDTNKLTCYSSNWISPPVIFSTPDDITYLARVEFNITMSLTSAHEFHDIMAIDFDPTGGAFFFSEINPQRIVMYLPTTEEEPVVMADQEVEAVEGVAFDWIYGNLYFTESRRNKVEVLSTKTYHRRVLFDTDLNQPGGIAVDPLHGYLYFTDRGDVPKIERGAMDGSTRAIIIHDGIHRPNGLCIEYTLGRLYWVDAALSYEDSYIGSSYLDGSGIQILIQGPSRVKQPFAITVLQDRIYWTDLEMESVLTANSFTGDDYFIALRRVSSPRDIRVWNKKAKYNGDNLCPLGESACSHMCFAAPNSNGFSCGCPGNNTLAEDMRTCLCNRTAILGKDGVSCGNDTPVQPTGAVPQVVNETNDDGFISKFDLRMTCNLFAEEIKCQTLESREISAIPADASESLNCRLFKESGELICSY